MVVRRSVDPLVVQAVWDGIRFISHQRQMANVTRLSRFLRRMKSIPLDQATTSVEACLKEQLIRLIPRKGTNMQSYKLPPLKNSPVDDGHDWYCFECHLAGDVEFCSSCHRVFHVACSTKSVEVVDMIVKTETTLPENEKDSNPVKRKSVIVEKAEVLNIKNERVSGENLMKNENSTDTEKENRNPEEKTDQNSETVINDSSSIAESSKLSNAISSELDNNENKTSINISSSENENKDKITSNNESNTESLTKCRACQIISEDKYTKIDSKELNYLFNFLLSRIRNWVPPSVTQTISMPPELPWQVEGDDVWRARYLLYKPMDVSVIEGKINAHEYDRLSELHADILSIRHNVAVYHGSDSTEVKAVDYMLNDALHDLKDIQQCSDCYRLSNGVRNKRWFCIPCKPPHPLVWAKQRGFCYWPAKVIKRTNDQYDVRFFGTKYVRAIINESNVRPIDTELADLKVKRSLAFNKALEELRVHQDWLNHPENIEKYTLDMSKQPAQPVPSVVMPKMKHKKVIKRKKKFKKAVSTVQSSDVYEFHEPLSNRPINRMRSAPFLRSTDKKKVNSESNDDFEDLIPAKKLKPSNSNKVVLMKKSNVDLSKLALSKRGKPLSSYLKPKRKLQLKHFDSSSDEISRSSQDDVISSSQDIQSPSVSHSELPVETLQSSVSHTNLLPIPSLNRHYSDTCEQLRRRLETCDNKTQMVLMACEAFQDQIDQHAKKIHAMKETNDALISELKKKPWCYNCEQEAIYYCCWNTSYCSTTCQQKHWQAEHKKTCRRKQQ